MSSLAVSNTFQLFSTCKVITAPKMKFFIKDFFKDFCGFGHIY